MENFIGHFNLTEKQITRLCEFLSEEIRSIYYLNEDNSVYVTSSGYLDNSTIEAIASGVSGVPDSYSYDYCKNNFNYTLFSGALNNMLDFDSISKLGSHMRTLEGYCQWKNFIESDLGNAQNAESFINYLEASGIANEYEAEAIRMAFELQGIPMSGVYNA